MTLYLQNVYSPWNMFSEAVLLRAPYLKIHVYRGGKRTARENMFSETVKRLTLEMNIFTIVCIVSVFVTASENLF